MGVGVESCFHSFFSPMASLISSSGIPDLHPRPLLAPRRTQDLHMLDPHMIGTVIRQPGWKGGDKAVRNRLCRSGKVLGIEQLAGHAGVGEVDRTRAGGVEKWRRQFYRHSTDRDLRQLARCKSESRIAQSPHRLQQHAGCVLFQLPIPAPMVPLRAIQAWRMVSRQPQAQ